MESELPIRIGFDSIATMINTSQDFVEIYTMINASVARKIMISDLMKNLRSNEPNKFYTFVTYHMSTV